MFTWERIAAAPRPASVAAAAPAPRFWTAFQRQQRLAMELLRVHALSSAIAYVPNAPLRVDAAQWWREIQHQSVAAVSQRRSRKRRLRPSGSSSTTASPPAPTVPVLIGTPPTATDPEDDEIAHAVEDLLVDALVRILQSLSAWTTAVNKPSSSSSSDHEHETQELLTAVEAALGDVGVALLHEWQRVPVLSGADDDGIDDDDDDDEPTAAALQCAVQVVNVLLQFYEPVGSFHAFHAHKLSASTAQRLFRTTPRWACSKCTRAWETHGASVPVLVFSCAACDFTLCRECFTRIPNSTTALQEIAIQRDLFQIQEPLQVRRFLSVVLPQLVAQDRALFDLLAPKLAITARGRLQDLLVYRSKEMVPMLEMVVDLFRIPEFARVLIENEPLVWLPMYLSSPKLRLYSFLGPLMWWTSMSDEPGEINLTPEGSRDGSTTALTLEWHEGYQQLRALLHQLFSLLLDDETQDQFVVDACLTYVASTIVCFRATRSSGETSDDVYDSILINLSSALVHLMLPVLTSQAHLIDTVYHESYVPQRVYLHKPEPLRNKAPEDETAACIADDRRVQLEDARRQADGTSVDGVSSTEFFYPRLEKHFGVLCDFCNAADFTGLRYKCAVCGDADICASCFEEFATRPLVSDSDQDTERARLQDQYHCTDHVFLRLDVPVPLLSANFYLPLEFSKDKLVYSAGTEGDSPPISAARVASEATCAECSVHLDQFDVYYRCWNCLDPRLVCPDCLCHEERHRDPNRVHLPGHNYVAIPRSWRRQFNPCGPGLYSRALVYPACIYPRERFSTQTELMYMTIEALHIGPLQALSKLLTTVKEMFELRSFCACEEERVEHEKKRAVASGRRPPKLSAHYAASQARLADLGATRLMAEMHLLEATNVVEWMTFYSKTCRWLLEMASPTDNAFKAIVTHFSSTFSAFPQHFFFDLCDMVHVLTLDGTTSYSTKSLGGIDYQSVIAKHHNDLNLLEPLLVMLVQLLATRKCTKNPHLRVQAAKALSSLLSFYAKNTVLASTLRKVFKKSVVLRDFAVPAILQFHEDMESYHIRNNGLVFNNNAGNGDHLLWGFLTIRVTTMLLLRFMWQFVDQRAGLAQAFRMKSRNANQAVASGDSDMDTITELHVANQVSMLITGLWSDAAKLFEEGNAKVGILGQLADIREALLEGRQIQLPFRPSMLEGYIALHSKHLRISMRMLVEVLELLSWIAGNTQLQRAMLRPEMTDQCARTTSFLIASLVSAYKASALELTWHHLADSKRVFAHLVFLVTRCAVGSDGGDKASSPSQFWSLIQESGNSMLRYIGDVEVHNRWTLNRAIVRMESARYLGEDTGEEFDRVVADVNQARHPAPKRASPLFDSDDLDENDALALLEQQSAEALTVGASSGAVKGRRGLARQLGNRFVSALAKDGRFDYASFMAGCDLLVRQSQNGGQVYAENDRDYEFVGLSWMSLFMGVLRRCQDMLSLQTTMDELLSDIPEEFLDPLLSTIMTDPVQLPSGNIVDRSVIERHLLSANRVDPFTREPLTLQMLTPCEPLRRQIQAYLRAKLQHLEHQKEDVLATWGLAWDCIFDVVADARDR